MTNARECYSTIAASGMYPPGFWCYKVKVNTISIILPHGAVQEQRFKHVSVWSRLLEDDQNHKPQARSFREQIPTQNSQHRLAK